MNLGKPIKSAQHSMAAALRPLGVRRRLDLAIFPQQVRGLRYWVVKDPLAMRYHRLREEEFAILEMLDGQLSSEEIQSRFEGRFAPQRLMHSRLHAFIGKLHRDGLVLVTGQAQSQTLLARHKKQRRQKLLQTFGNPLAIRLPGVDPEPLLRRLYPLISWMFAPTAVAAGVLLMVAALCLIAVEFDSVMQRLPSAQSFFTSRNLIWMAGVLAATKILHELGHALTCRHFRGRCHEIGLIFLVFTPCLYCNVSDSWTLPNRWHRIAISLAGIYVELLLAAICVVLWWFSQPGLLNQLCFNVMFVCSVATIMFNANPLLRFDGYFVLSDLLAEPNLGPQSKAIVRNKLTQWCLGFEQHDERALPHRRQRWLAVYGVASTLYLVFVVVAILWFVYQTLAAYRLEVIARFFAAAVVVGLLAPPIIGAAKFLSNPAQRRRIQTGRLFATIAFLAGLIAAICWLPMPYRIVADVVIEPVGARRIYVTVPGSLIDSVRAGEQVEAGQVLARLTNEQVELELADLFGQRDVLRQRLKNLQARRGESSQARVRIPATQKELADVENQLSERQHDSQRLTLRAPFDGTVLSPPDKSDASEPTALPTWSGSPLTDKNRTGFLDTGTLLCLVGDLSRMEAILIVDQADIDFVRAGQSVRLDLDQLPGEILTGEVVEVARIDLDTVPEPLVSDGRLAARDSGPGAQRPVETAYQARVALDAARPLLLRSRGTAKINVDAQPVASRIYRYLQRTFTLPGKMQ